jgi:membrane protease YdiL (CAAX protease family)
MEPSAVKGTTMAGTELYASGSYRRTWALLTIPLVWLFVYAGVWLSGRIAGIFGLYVSAASGRWQDNLTALFASAPVLLLLWLWLRFFEGRPLRSVGLGPWQGRRFGAGILSGFLLVATVVAAVTLAGGFEITGPGAWYDHLTPTWIFASVLAIAGSILQAMVTEALFRGWMLQNSAGQWGAVPAVAFNIVACLVVQGGLGALRSPEAVLGIINIAILSWYMCLRAMRDQSLWGICGFHAAWTLTMGWGMGLNVDGGRLSVTPGLLKVETLPEAPWLITGGNYGPNASVVMTLVAVFALLTCLRGRTKGPKSSAQARDRYETIIDH